MEKQLKYFEGAFEDLSPGECFEIEGKGKRLRIAALCIMIGAILTNCI